MQRIADEAGVSKSTVSLALRNDARIPEATKKKIRRIAGDLGYRRNPVVDTLMTQLRASRTPTFQSTLGLVNCSANPDLYANHTFRAFRDGVKERSETLGYRVEEFWLEEPHLRPERLRQILDTRAIRGLILIATLVPHEIHERYRDFWDHFACAVIGVTHLEASLPCATNDQYLTAKGAFERVLARGYRRPALAIEPLMDELLDRKFTAGFLTATRGLKAADRLPVFDLDLGKPEKFLQWVRRRKPDVLVTNKARIKDWLEEAGFSIPGDIGLVHLDWFEDLEGWAGMNQNNEEVAAAGADLVINQLNKNEIGPQRHPKLVLLESEWVEGPSVRPA